ncbi:hypothetical protein [Lutibaculum baratangense]|uniref:Uncharacterized protein n=1 Tax=Lutibaculum baratangense AMV1 TaxID=631454 RepID=V4T9H1_9HYPH|nr:hypothetical protein [Lutibaculum baratangense]ESR23173.1 hypothetical protein N177_3241 [Lutibaculum baratangense AMV1]
MAEHSERITITDIDIPFVRLVMIFIKWSLAAIPAAIIVSFIISFLMMLFAGIFGGMGMMFGGGGFHLP